MSAANKQSKINFLKNIRLAKSCYLAVICFIVCFLSGVAAALPISLTEFNEAVLSQWAVTLTTLNSNINSMIFFWNVPLLRNEARKALKNLC